MENSWIYRCLSLNNNKNYPKKSVWLRLNVRKSVTINFAMLEFIIYNNSNKNTSLPAKYFKIVQKCELFGNRTDLRRTTRLTWPRPGSDSLKYNIWPGPVDLTLWPHLFAIVLPLSRCQKQLLHFIVSLLCQRFPTDSPLPFVIKFHN